MKRHHALAAMAGGAAFAGGYRPIAAQVRPFKIGIVFTYSGPDFVGLGKQLDAGLAVYMQQHGDTIAGRKVELIRRDDTGPAPDVAARLAQELIVQDQVDVLLGSLLTPNAIAMARISTQAKKPYFNVNAATSNIVKNAPYSTRYGFTTASQVTPFARWAYFSGVKSAHVLYQNYGPGIDAGGAFTKSFQASGGHVTGESRVPYGTADFSAYIQRVKDDKPDGVYVFIDSHRIEFLKALRTAGIDKAGIKLLSSGDLLDESALQQEGDAALGTISYYGYSAAHPSKVNQEFVRLFRAQYGGNQDPNFLAVQGYDALHAIYQAAKAQNGNADPDRTLAIVKTLRWESPRGPVWMNPVTRMLMQNVYVRRTETRNGKLENVEFAKMDFPRDPNEEAGPT